MKLDEDEQLPDGPLSEPYLRDVLARLRAASPGPWAYEDKRAGGADAIEPRIVFVDDGKLEAAPEDLSFIAHAREDIRLLLHEVAWHRDRWNQLITKLTDEERATVERRVKNSAYTWKPQADRKAKTA